MKIKRKQMQPLLIVFYFLAFFPYLKITPLRTDIQPGAMILAFLVVLLSITIKKKGIPQKTIPFIVVAFASVAVFFAGGPSTAALRILLGYISLPIIIFGSYLIIKKNGEINIEIIKLVIWLWFIVGIIQVTINPYFGGVLISNMRTGGYTGVRGVTSLAVEPTYFGQMMYFLMFYVFIFFEKRKEKFIYVSICVISIFFLAKSSMIVLILGFNVFIFLVNSISKRWGLKTLKYIAISFVVVFIGVVMLNSLPDSSRLVRTMDNILNQGLIEFFQKDASSNHRLSSIFFSFKGAFENFLFPNGFADWKNYEIFQKSQSTFFWYGTTDRIMSMYGALLYELGFIGLYVIYLINYWLIKFIKHLQMNYYKFPILAYINLIFMTAVPIATPFVGFLLATLMYYSEKLAIDKKITKHTTSGGK